MMVTFGILLIIHGLIHLYYCVCSLQVSSNAAWLKWPGESYLFTRFFGSEVNSVFATLFCLLSSIGFITSGILFFLSQNVWQAMVVISVFLSSLIFVLFWDGDSFDFGRKGGIVLLVNLIIFLMVVIFHWPV